MILTLVCLKPNEWIVVEDDGFFSAFRGIDLKPASSRQGTIVHGPTNHHSAAMFIANRNRYQKEKTA